MYNQGMGLASQCVERAGKFFQFLESEQADLIAGRTVKRQFNDAFVQNPRHRSSLKMFHVLCPSKPAPCALLWASGGKGPTTNDRRLILDCHLHPIHALDLGAQSLSDQIPPELAVRGEQAILDCERLAPQMKGADLPIVRKLRIDGVH